MNNDELLIKSLIESCDGFNDLSDKFAKHHVIKIDAKKPKFFGRFRKQPNVVELAIKDIIKNHYSGDTNQFYNSLDFDVLKETSLLDRLVKVACNKQLEQHLLVIKSK